MPQHIIHESYGDYQLRQDRNSNSFTAILAFFCVIGGISLIYYARQFIAGILFIAGGIYFFYSYNKRLKILGKKYKERSATLMTRISYG